MTKHHRFSDPGERYRMSHQHNSTTLSSDSSSRMSSSEEFTLLANSNGYDEGELEVSTNGNGHLDHLDDHAKDELLLAVEDGHGLVIESVGDDGEFRMYATADNHVPQVHPNAHVPRFLKKFKLLKGGGSGITVFGASGNNKDYVLKHGGWKDLREVFSLAALAQEFQMRGDGCSSSGNEATCQAAAAAAATDMRRRIPQFQFLYLSSYHLRDRGKERWQVLRKLVAQKFYHPQTTRPRRKLKYFERCDSNYCMREIRLWKTSSRVGVEVDCGCVDLFLGPNASFNPQSLSVSVPDFDTVHKLLHDDLYRHQKDHLWKFTLAQQRIGNADSENGAFVHTSGRLSQDSPHLQTLLREFSRVIKDLQLLTSPKERNAVQQLRLELRHLREDGWDVEQVSAEADAFCGLAIKKNFKPGGRFDKLRRYGELFRQGDALDLTEEELEPAKFLGVALECGCNPMEHVFFDNAKVSSTALDVVTGEGDSCLWWPILLEEAVNSCQSQSAVDRIWTSRV